MRGTFVFDGRNGTPFRQCGLARRAIDGSRCGRQRGSGKADVDLHAASSSNGRYGTHHGFRPSSMKPDVASENAR